MDMACLPCIVPQTANALMTEGYIRAAGAVEYEKEEEVSDNHFVSCWRGRE